MKKIIILVVAILIAMPAVASAGLISDSGFEGTDPWSYYESNSDYIEDFDATSDVYSGSGALEVMWLTIIPSW